MPDSLKKLEKIIGDYENFIEVSSDEVSRAQARVLLENTKLRYDALLRLTAERREKATLLLPPPYGDQTI